MTQDYITRIFYHSAYIMKNLAYNFLSRSFLVGTANAFDSGLGW